MYCFALIAGLLAHPIATDEKIEGMYCTEDGEKIVTSMQAPAADRLQFSVFDGELISEPDEAAQAWLKVQEKTTMGYVNLHTGNTPNDAGDGVWYPLDHVGKTQHLYDPTISLNAAKSSGVKIGG